MSDDLAIASEYDREARECCDYCGKPGHDWTIHEEARAEARAWQREDDAANERQELSGWWFRD